MLYDVKELSSKLGVSAVTIYAKLKLKEVKPFVVLKEGKSYVMEEGLELIKQSIKLNQSLNLEEVETAECEAASTIAVEKEGLKDMLIQTLQKQVEDLIRERDVIRAEKQEEIVHLRGQIGVKDNQIATRDKHVENMQVLLKNEQEQSENIKTLPESLKEHDIHLVNTLSESMKRQKQFYEMEELSKMKKKKNFLGVFLGSRH